MKVYVKNVLYRRFVNSFPIRILWIEPKTWESKSKSTWSDAENINWNAYGE